MPGPVGPLFEGDGDLEFLSEEWVNAARIFLEAEIPKHAAELEANKVKFTLCEAASNAPGHLAKPGTKLGWCLFVDGAKFSVEAGIANGDKATTKVDILDYDAALGQARFVAGEASWSPARLKKLRESPPAPGMPVLPPPMDEILMKLHDAMAVRTMPHFEAYSENWIRVGDSYIQRQANLPENQEILKIHKGSYIFCEALTGAPTYLSPDKKSDVTGFYVVLRDGKLKMHHGVPQAPEKADYEIKMDYWVNNPVGGFVINGRDKEDTDHFNRVVMKGLQDAMTVTQNKESKAWRKDAKLFQQVLATNGEGDQGMHDALARRTYGTAFTRQKVEHKASLQANASSKL